MPSKAALLRSLTMAELKDIARQHDFCVPSGAKKGQAVKCVAENLDLSDDELSAIVDHFAYVKLVA